ncbi:hypothetical protein [Kribbella sindirgiensis]|uniref:Uncharacterized protein n=1 Tax=Kribbella sindirgiensis TaxID=1124744 RepID=A0A4R0ISU7_9ACTN|nr:hypothetical protein [Kribbella sindirgiensis]TCC36933.1 hypothetical protein E0H50_09610 [Kribbella sindirgiensis]
MKKVTHALTMNGRVHGEVKDPDLLPREVIEQRLGLLDGVDRYSLSLWRLPVGVPFDRVDLAVWPQEYVQVAGSADRMTVEVRRPGDPGERQYVVGRAVPDNSGPAGEVVIRWNGCESRVYSYEVFSAAEAAEVFVRYYETGQVPDTFRLRALPL